MSSIAKLGFDIKDVKVLLNSEPHPDHGGGLTVLQQASGAQLWASDASADSLASGGDDPDVVLPLRALTWIGVVGYPPPRADHRFKDGDTIRVGPIALTAHITGGHTRGCTSWSFPVRDGDRMLNGLDSTLDNRHCPFLVSHLAPGDIVRHSDYPQWGRGYVIRARKTSSDVFFRWGGKRRIDAGEPIEPSRASGVEAQFFSMCADLSPRSWSRGHHSVYAIELDLAVWKNRAFRERNPGGAASGCLYVGVTGLTPDARFQRHRAGTQSGRFVRTHGLRLRLDLVEGFSRLPYRIAACMEPKLAAWLRAQGFAVWQN